MRRAVIVDAVRTPTGKRDGYLREWHPADLAGYVLHDLVERTGLDPAIVDDVIMGCVSQTGEQAFNIGRNALLAAGFPESVPGVTIDRQCGSSQQAAHFGAQGIMAGVYDVVIAAGVESMTRIPMGVTASQGPGYPFGTKVMQRYDLVPQGLSAEMIADEWDLSRERLDEISLESQRRAAQATDEGRFKSEIVPIPGPDGVPVIADEGIRRDTSAERLAALRPAFKPDGKVTAGNSSQISDGAAAVLIMSEDKAHELGMQPLARFVDFAVVGVDPVTMLKGPIPATKKVLDRTGLTMGQIDRFEINEAFASVIGAWLIEMDEDPDTLWERTNVNGGAIALGHPLGCSGAKLMTTLVHELQRSGTRYGLQAMCEGGGMANATILERVG
ncbi:3-ketoacyl-CoA thiolase [bacterium BMS3Abin02]|nr:3-ketoacyl-CoA thiolase [bacterium BMS3Abin02]GBE22020.1 3-ketoacyl-CoA thiolase [bacterium BMS3Bbin01]HDH26479.1 thiolase family protein [Actinomycetota bacterium]HDL48635.1 thiolase family protein [Actinomycetota bacterium]